MSAGKRIEGTPEPSHRWPGYGGLMLAGDKWGNESAPLVLLLHGGGQTRHAWKETGECLAAAGYQAVAYDARGHGDSEWARESEYSVDFMVEDLRATSERFGSSNPILVGASMGGITSLITIGEGKMKATALVLVDVVPQFVAEGAQEVLNFMRQRPEGFETLDEVADAIASYQQHRPRPRNLHGLSKNVRLAPDGRYKWHWDPAWCRASADVAETRQRLAAAGYHLNTPTLLVRGALSHVLSDESVAQFLAQCPHAEYVNIENAAHMVAGDKNDVFGQATLDFLKRAVPLT